MPSNYEAELHFVLRILSKSELQTVDRWAVAGVPRGTPGRRESVAQENIPKYYAVALAKFSHSVCLLLTH